MGLQVVDELAHAGERGGHQRATVVVRKDDGATWRPLCQRLIEIGVVAVRIDRQQQGLPDLLLRRESSDVVVDTLVEVRNWRRRAGGGRGWCSGRDLCWRRRRAARQ